MNWHAGRIGNPDAEGATASETLRQKDRIRQKTLESDTFVSAEGIAISGNHDRGGTSGELCSSKQC